MRACQYKTGGAVIPIRRQPGCRRMTGLAFGWESGQGMIRILLGVVALLVA